MEQPTKFATPAEEAVTMDNQGRMRVTMDPVSETNAELFRAGAETREPGTAPVEAEPNQRMPSLAHPFVTLPEDAIDADAEYGKYLLASQLRSIGVEPFPEPTQSPDDMMLAGPSGEAQSDGRSISGQVGQAIVKGLDQGGRELMDSFAFLAGAPVEAAKNVMNVGLEAVGMEPIKNAFGDIDSMRTVVGAYQNAVDEAIPVPESVRDWASQPYDNEILGGLVEGITQFGVAAVPAAKLVKAMTTYNAAARGFVWGAIADFTAFNPDDPTLANGIIDHLQSLPPEEQMPVLQSFLSVMAKHETDSEFVKRAKMAYEGAKIGVAIELIAKGAIKVANKIPFQQIADTSKRAIGNAGEAADARIAERAADTGVTLGAGVDPMPMIDEAISAAGRAVRPAKNVDEARAAYDASPNDPVLRQQYLDLRRARDAELSQMPVSEQLELDTSYRMQHQPRGPQDGGGRLDDITAGGELFPDDVYSANGLRFYGNPKNLFDQQSHAAILAARGNPEAEITIYRAVPTNVDQINTGDWVTLSPDYAAMHAGKGYGPNGDQAGKVISIKVKVKDVFSDGNDLNEFGYFPEDLTELGVKKVVPPKETEPGIIAFHGSGADFDEFRLEMIGTGEGAQAYGYGLYFTQSEDIAKFYRDGVAFAQTLRGKSKINYKGKPFEDLGDTAAAEAAPPSYNAIMSIASEMQKLTGSFSKSDSAIINQAESAKLRVLKQLDADIEKYTKASQVPGAEGIVIGPNGPTLENLLVQDLKQQKQAVLDIDANDIELQLGKIYKVGLAPKPDELVDYDLSLNQQSEKIKKALQPFYEKYGVANTADVGTLLESAKRTGAIPDDAFTEKLVEAGIPGIKYRAAGSRGATVDTADAEMNFVIFDDKMIKILEKYGIVGPMAVTAAGVKSSEDELIENEA